MVFGGRERAPEVLLDNHYGTVTLGQPFAAASLLNRLQASAAIPLMNAADFEAGLGFRLAGRHDVPAADGRGGGRRRWISRSRPRASRRRGARALGVHVNLSPVADVNNNARNPVINTRSFGERPDEVGRFVSAYVRGLRAGGMLSTLKHFPGHGDTDVDSHVGLPIIQQPRDRLDRIELPPFRAGIAAGADAVMTAHIQLPDLDPGEFSPATLSHPIVTGLLRGELKFDGLIYTDSMGMDAVARRLSPGEAAVLAIKAGNDVVLHSPDDAAAVAGIKAAVEQNVIPLAQIDASVRRLLRAKARLGLHKTRTVPLDDLPKLVGGRAHAEVARNLSAKSITLVKDDRNQVPLRVPRRGVAAVSLGARLSVGLAHRCTEPDVPSGAAPALAVGDGGRAIGSIDPVELDLVRTTAARYDGIVVSVFVRTASGSGRMDLAQPLVTLLGDLGAHHCRHTEADGDGVLRQSVRRRRRCPRCRRCCLRTTTTTWPSSRPCARSLATRRLPAGCRSACRACSRQAGVWIAELRR